jgi:hypothetical protein
MTHEEQIAKLTEMLEMQQKLHETAIDMLKPAIEAEREACAEICDTWPLSAQNMIRMDSWKGNKSNAVAGSIYECASLIRARGQA